MSGESGHSGLNPKFATLLCGTNPLKPQCPQVYDRDNNNLCCGFIQTSNVKMTYV